MKEEHFKWYSPTLSKDIEMLVFGHSGYPVILFPTTMGKHNECRDMKLVESARWYLEQGIIQIYCPDSINELSWYNKNIHLEDTTLDSAYQFHDNHEVITLKFFGLR